MFTINDFIGNLSLDSRALVRNSYPQESWKMETILEAFSAIGRKIVPGFVIDSYNKGLYVNLAYWLMNDPRMTCIDPSTRKEIPARLDKGIYLAGGTGTGKTVAMTIVRLLYPKNKFRRGDPPACYGWTEARADEIVDTFQAEGTTRVKTSGLLCIQDLGCEPTEAVYMGNRINVMKSLLEVRGDNLSCVTMVTSNLPLASEEIRRRYGDRAQSRLYEMENYLELRGPDRRMNH